MCGPNHGKTDYIFDVSPMYTFGGGCKPYKRNPISDLLYYQIFANCIVHSCLCITQNMYIFNCMLTSYSTNTLHIHVTSFL